MNPFFDPDFTSQHNQLISDFNLARQQQPASEQAINNFQSIIWHHYNHKKRPFAWRAHPTPYNVVVSEIMLQQTQTSTVAPKFDAYIKAFPNFQTLADASFSEVLRHWKGLGYNRRAMALQKIAQLIISNHQGILPSDSGVLESFPGIGPATARSILAFAYNVPTAFIETNIRTVFIYFFFKNEKEITDKQLFPLVQKAVDQHNPREWYYALMDYGVMLKKTVGNVSKLSAHYTRQSTFQGSDRQIRGLILQVLLDFPNGVARHQLATILNKDPERVEKIMLDLHNEKFVTIKNNLVRLS